MRIELGRARRENISPSVRTLGPRADLKPNIFPSGPPTQSISRYFFRVRFREVLIYRLSQG